MKCNCCKKEVPYKKIWTKASLLFNGCENCWDYLTTLMKELRRNK